MTPVVSQNHNGAASASAGCCKPGAAVALAGAADWVAVGEGSFSDAATDGADDAAGSSADCCGSASPPSPCSDAAEASDSVKPRPVVSMTATGAVAAR